MHFIQSEKHTVLISPITKTSTSTATANLDCLGFKTANITVAIGTAKNTSGTFPKTIKLSESDDTVVTNFADISGATCNGSLVASGSVRFNVDLRKRKRYIKLTVTPETTTNDDILLYADAVLGRAETLPASTSGMGDTVVTIL